MTTKKAFSQTGAPHIIESKIGQGFIVLGHTVPGGEVVLKISLPRQDTFLLTKEGAKALADGLQAVLAETPDDPAQQKLNLD